MVPSGQIVRYSTSKSARPSIADAHRFVDAGPVVGVDGLEEVLVGERGLRRPSVVRLAGLRAGERPAGEVELPAAELADIQGEAQLALALPEGLGLPLAFGGVVAVRVLALAVAEGGPDRADEGRDRDRPLDQGHVAHRLEGPGGLRRVLPRGGQHQQGDVRPGGLRLEHAEEARRGVGEDRLLGQQGRPDPPAHLAADLVHVLAGEAGHARRGEDVPGRRGVPRRGGEQEDSPLEEMRFRVRHRRPSGGNRRPR